MKYEIGFAYLISNTVGTILGVLFLILSLVLTRKKGYREKVIPIRVLFFFLVTLEIIKIFFLIGDTGAFNPKSYPIIYCSSSMYFYAIIGFGKEDSRAVRLAKGAVIIPFFVMGILYYVSFPGLGNRMTDLRGLILHTHSRTYHLLMLYAAIYMIAAKMYDFRFKDFIPVSMYSACYFQAATFLSLFIGGEISNFGPRSPELGWLYEKTGYATGNLMLGITAIFVGFLVYGGIALIRMWIKKSKEKKRLNYDESIN